MLGSFGAALIRLHLISPTGAILSDETYSRMFTMHGIVMVWLFLVPSIPVTLGNFLVPLMLGAKDLAFPRLNLISWYLFIMAGALVVYGLFRGGWKRDGPSTRRSPPIIRRAACCRSWQGYF